MAKIFLVEDDRQTAESLIRFLSHIGYHVFHSSDGINALKEIRQRRSQLDLIILDIGLPSMDGISLCKRLRSEGMHTPIIILTTIDKTDSVVTALETGADDYLSKPFIMTELQARIKSLLRRPTQLESVEYATGDLRVNTTTRVAAIAGRSLQLRRKEFDILAVLIKHKGQVMSREQILISVWGHGEAPSETTVDVYVRQIRKELRDQKHLLSTVHGVGYKLAS